MDLFQKPLAIVDLETTGGKANQHRIIEIGILRVENGQVVEEFSSLVNPERDIPPSITALTGINQMSVYQAPVFKDIAPRVLDLIRDCIFVAHNVRFDYGFIRNELERLSYSYSARTLCSVRLSRMLYHQHRRHDLGSIIKRFDFPCKDRHRALEDARMVWFFLQKISETLPQDRVTNAYQQLLKQPSLPPNIRQASIDALPDAPGVYIFRDEFHTPLYIGKSKNIRERVLSHFASDHRFAKEMMLSRKITDIECRRTSGELGALLLEANLIKTLKPLHNRRSRHAQELNILIPHENKHGYLTLDIQKSKKILPEDVQAAAAFFPSTRVMKEFLKGIAKGYQLCPELLGLESRSETGCFSFHIQQCKGACIGADEPEQYNQRFTEAMFKHRIKAWPFKGPVMVRETDLKGHKGEVFVLDQWILQKAVSFEGDDVSSMMDLEAAFDLEVYKIFKRYLSQNFANVQDLRPEHLNELLPV